MQSEASVKHKRKSKPPNLFKWFFRGALISLTFQRFFGLIEANFTKTKAKKCAKRC